MINRQVGFIGGGNMARAIAGGLLRGGMHATRLCVSEPLDSQQERLRRELYGVQITSDNTVAARQSDVLLFAVKPQILESVCGEVADAVQTSKPLIVSIAAGARIGDIERWLGGNLSIVRVMPNQPALIDMGIAALFANERTGAEARSLAEAILSAVGHVVWVESEEDMDAVTALSGTGPAYFYLLIDVMIRCAVDYGLDEPTARALAVETARGASALAAAETESMSAMIDRVRSPGGTTQAAFEFLDARDVRGIFSRAIEAARQRAVELSRPSDDHS
ncbi:MAG: pyrroline-5-carboxylate reductase [Woeseiaceae bacterium]|nr:pyrroline-5-carboxylate reductase [Woeseiaceae bacterium]